MIDDGQANTKGPRFALRTVLVWIAIVAVFIGWYASWRRQRATHSKLLNELMAAKLQVKLAESRNEIQADATSSQLQGVDLQDAVIQSGSGAFQRAVFDNSNLTNASLTGGAASFQGASFKNAILRNARLVGGGSSFQLASFDNADLSGAILDGNLQGISLANAICVGTTIKGSFQGANIDGTHFQNADLSAIRNNDLKSCYYDTPPTYDAKTKFPSDFDPVAMGWKKAESTSS